jgi:hypothetical protein
MDACADPTMARILADAPAVLGIEACRALDAMACAPLLFGFLNEAAGLVAAAPTDRVLRRRVTDTVDEFVTRLFG